MLLLSAQGVCPNGHLKFFLGKAPLIFEVISALLSIALIFLIYASPFQVFMLALARPLICFTEAIAKPFIVLIAEDTAATIVHVPLVVKVWIVFAPDVVIVPPVDDVETPVEPSVG